MSLTLVAAALASVVTLYCDTTLSTNGEAPEPTTDQRVFTVDYEAGTIYVVSGSRKERTLKAKAITPSSIEFPDYEPLDFFTTVNSSVSGGGVERIDRTTGAYESRTFMWGKSPALAKPWLDLKFHYRGTCRPGETILPPTAKF